MSANDPTVPDEPRVFRYDGEVRPSEKRHVRFEVSETYLGDPVEVSVTIVNGSEPGPRVFCTAAVHGDELNGVKVCQELARRYDPADLAGTLVVVHVVNVPAFHAQQRYIPIYDLDLNRSFPGQDGAGNTAERMAAELWEAFLSKCDVGLDFHTSTRNRTTMFHTRADVAAPGVERLAKAFGTNVVLAGGGDEGSLRAAATRAGIPTVTVEMGKAHRFQPVLTEKALDGVASVLAEYDLIDGAVSWPSWFRVVSPEDQKAWLRADEGGLVDMRWGPYPPRSRGRDHLYGDGPLLPGGARRRGTVHGPARRRPREPGRAPGSPALSPGQRRRGDGGGDRRRDPLGRVRRLSSERRNLAGGRRTGVVKPP